MERVDIDQVRRDRGWALVILGGLFIILALMLTFNGQPNAAAAAFEGGIGVRGEIIPPPPSANLIELADGTKIELWPPRARAEARTVKSGAFDGRTVARGYFGHVQPPPPVVSAPLVGEIPASGIHAPGDPGVPGLSFSGGWSSR